MRWAVCASQDGTLMGGQRAGHQINWLGSSSRHIWGPIWARHKDGTGLLLVQACLLSTELVCVAEPLLAERDPVRGGGWLLGLLLLSITPFLFVVLVLHTLPFAPDQRG